MHSCCRGFSAARRWAAYGARVARPRWSSRAAFPRAAPTAAMASALSAGQQLSALIAGTSIEQLRAQWSLTAARALVRNAPPESKLRTDPHAIDRVPEGGKLRAEDFLVLIVVVWQMPQLTARQQVTLPSGDLPNVRVCISPLPHYGYASSNPARDIAAKVKSGQLSKGNAGGPDAVLVAANTRLALYQFQLSLIKEPLLLAHWRPSPSSRPSSASSRARSRRWTRPTSGTSAPRRRRRDSGPSPGPWPRSSPRSGGPSPGSTRGRGRGRRRDSRTTTPTPSRA